jgi:flagellar hook-associated protein 3 FlgL
VRLKELAVYQSSETANAQTRSAVAEEVSAIRGEIVRIANTQYKGSYIFSGYQTQTAPFDTTGTYYGDKGVIAVNVGDEVGVKVNLIGDELFKGDGGGVDIFLVADGLIQGLRSNDTEAIQGQIEPLDDALSQVLSFRAQVGAGLNRMETMGNIYADFKLNTQELLSNVEDVDVIEAMTRLASEEAAYKASLETAARIMSQSLLDFI